MKNLTFAEMLQLITAITTLVGVIGGVLVSLKNGTKLDMNAGKIDENTSITKAAHDETSVKLTEISTKVSNTKETLK